MNPTITVSSDVTLVSLQNISADMNLIADIFEKISGLCIDVDMISLSPVQSATTSLSFTIKDEDLFKFLEHTSDLSGIRIKPIVSSGNYIISVLDKEMENNPGVAARLFRTLAEINTDIRVISTSEVQISILVTPADFEAANEAIEACVKSM